MPIPTNITDLSTTPASNSPAGSENPIEGDNHLRVAYSFIRQLYDGITASGNVQLAQLASDATASLGAGLSGFDWDLLYAQNTSGWGIRTGSNGYNVLRHIPVAQWAAIFDGTSTYDATAAVQAALTAANAKGLSLYTPGKRYFFDGGQLEITGRVYGDGRKVTNWVFGGTPTKAVRTRVVWRTEYDTGDYTSNSDASVAAAVTLAAQGAEVSNLTIITNHDPTTNYPLPFDSATDFPTSNYEFGLLVQGPLRATHSVNVEGVWNTAALCLDGSNVGGFGDGFEATNSTFSGMWGVRIQGPQGQPISGDDYQDPTSSDTRGAAGLSDVVFSGCKIYDTSGSLRLTINGVANKLVRRSATTGALYVNGQVSANSAKRIQGIHFNNCRFASSDRYVYFANYVNRLRFTNCHSEYRSGGYDTDGVTPLVAADCEIRNTENSRRLVFLAGEKSGETDNRTFKNTTLNIPIISEVAFDDPNPPGSIPANSMLMADGLRDRGTWTPSLTASTPGTPTYSTRSGYYAKIGNMVFIQGRITLSAKGGITGNISIGDLPFTASNLLGGTAQDTQIVVMPSSITTGDAGTAATINDNTTTASLIKIRSAAAIANITDADLVDTSRVDFSGWYMTEDA